jgi:glycosyltransferase involved in cell wall biosynthesis
LRDTAKKATIALGVTRESCEIIRKLGAQRVVQLPSGSLTDEELVFFDNMPPPPENGPFRVLCLGRLLHWKGFYLAIRAFAIFARKNPEAELWIVGTGPFQEELEKTAAQTGVSSQVRFWGYLPHAEAMEKLAQAHVLLHPALHEGFGHVCLEAMACGRPVACLDVGGPATQVTAETGFVAPVTNPEEAVQAMASFLARIAHDRDYMAELSAKGRARVREEFTMRQTGAALSAFYAEAIASHAEAPRRNS